jgi:hypothetical protein
VKDFSHRYIKSLQSKPTHPNYVSIHWADYIELLCIANLDGEVSRDDVIERLEERGNDLNEGDPHDIDEFNSFDSDEGEIASRRGERDDKWKTLVNDWFKVLKVRTATYGRSYPFKVNEKEITIYPSLTQQQKVYVYLLLCSNLYLLDKRTQNILANSFELLSCQTLKAILPTNAEVHLFGSNPYNKNGKYSKTTFWDRMGILANDLYEELNPKISKDEYPPTNKGDGGLDIVAWIPTGDNLPSMPIFFAQCACTTEWVTKQNDSAFQAWINKLSLTNYTNNLIFIPFCYRGANGNWFKPGDIRLSFLIDRKRILFYLKELTTFKGLPSTKIVDEIIKSKEGIV